MRVIAGSARSLPLKTVPTDRVRPTTDRIKETLFNMIAGEIPGARMLDLFAGSGAIGIEALSRGASEAVFVERDRAALSCIKENLQFTKLMDRARVLPLDVFRALDLLETEGKPFSLIFMDPPYDLGLEKQVLKALEGKKLADENTLIIYEASIKTDTLLPQNSGFEVVRIKKYTTNQHVFLKKKIEERL